MRFFILYNIFFQSNDVLTKHPKLHQTSVMIAISIFFIQTVCKNAFILQLNWNWRDRELLTVQRKFISSFSRSSIYFFYYFARQSHLLPLGHYTCWCYYKITFYKNTKERCRPHIQRKFKCITKLMERQTRLKNKYFFYNTRIKIFFKIFRILQ